MAHNIQTRDIQTGLEMAWHKLTNVVEKIDGTNAGILYPMYIAETFFKTPDGVEVTANGRQIVTADDNLPVGRPVGSDYKLISNQEIWDAVQEGLSGTQHQIVSCGSVSDRALGFVSVKVADNFIAAKRDTQNVMNILWGHGGNKAVTARSGFTVVVCQNTFNMAMAEKSDFKLSLRHTANANVLDLSKAIDAHIGVAAEFKLAMDKLDSVDVKQTEARKIFAGFISGGEAPETKTGISRFTNTLDRIQELFIYGKGNAGRTMADVFNGITDFYSHESTGGTAWKQFASSEFGASSTRKTEFFDVVSDDSALRDTVKRGEKVLLALGL